MKEKRPHIKYDASFIVGTTRGLRSKLCNMDGLLYPIDDYKFIDMLDLADICRDAIVWSWKENNVEGKQSR